MDKTHIVALIMAGGGGTRFWPRSRKARPKQFLAFDGEDSLLSLAVRRLDGLVSPENTLVITGGEHVDLAREHTGLPASSVIGEPFLRDTAACIGYGTLLARRLAKNPTVLVLPADHLISPREGFQKVMARASRIATESDSLVTIGLRPDRPATGYGYIETGAPIDEEQPSALRVSRFREKPVLEEAKQFLADGRFLWNSGMLCFRASTMLTALEEHLPHLHSGLMGIQDLDDREQVASVYETLQRVSIDFGVLERARDVVVVEADFEWDDVGTFEAVARYARQDDEGNRVRGQAAFVQCSGNLVENDEAGLVVISGVSDLLVVRARDAVLIVPRQDSERVKEVVRHLEENGLQDYL